MNQRLVDSWWRQWTCVGGSCGPPPPSPRNRFERALDAYTNLTAPFVRGCFVFVTVALVVLASSRLGRAGGVPVQAAFLLLIATYCLANFARCREAHCIVTGLGYLSFAIVGAWAVFAGRDVRSGEWIAFLAITLLGHAFEALWRRARGTNALRLARTARQDDA